MYANKNAPLRRTIALLAMVIALVLAGSACRGSDGAAAEGGTIKVGVLLGLTGDYAALGEPERKSIELFFDRVNAQGGINGRKVELVVVDSASDETEAVNQLRRLATQEEVHAVIGPSSSGESIALKPISQQLQVPVISLASSEDIVTPPEQAEYMFKEFVSTDVSLQAQLSYAESQGWQRVAILGVNDGYGQEPLQDLPAAIKDFDLQLVSSESFPPEATDVTSQLTRIASSRPDVVLVWAVNPASAIVARSAQSIGFEPVLFHSPGAASEDYVKNAGAAAEGTLVQGSKISVADAITKDDPQYEVTTDLVEAYQDKFGAMPNQYAANGWDGALLLKEALQSADLGSTDTQAVRDAIRDSLEQNIQDLAGVNAVYSYSEAEHGPTGIEGLAILGVENGEFTLEEAY